MANRSFLDPKDEFEDKSPDSSIASRPLGNQYDDVMNLSQSAAMPSVDAEEEETTLPPPSQQVKDYIKQRRMPSSSTPTSVDSDPLMQRYHLQQAEIEDARQKKNESDFITNLGQSFSNLGRGANAPIDQDAFYKTIDQQNKERLESKEKDSERYRKIVEAIENRNLRRDNFDAKRTDQDLQRQLIQATNNQRREDKKEKESKLSDKQVEAFNDLDTAVSDLQNIKGLLGSNSNWTGPLDGRIPDALVGGDQVAWRSALGKFKDAYRKAVTGAGASASELAMLESRLPNEKDTFSNFQAKLNESLSELSKHRSTLTKNLGRQGKNVSPYESDSIKMESPSGKIIVTNGKEQLSIDPSDLADAESEGFRRL